MVLAEHYQDRYLCDTKQQLYSRVANVMTEVNDIQELLEAEVFIPAGNTLVAGTKDIYPNCSILGQLTDQTEPGSVGSVVFQTADQNLESRINLAQKLWSNGTGVGFDLSGLTEPVKVLKRLSEINDRIDLGHRPKRGNMAVLSSKHPKIKEFINCKDKGSTIYNFNISVYLEQASDLTPDLLELIAQKAWETGDPGLINLEQGRKYGPVLIEDLEPVTTCVPCGEQFMHAFETCNLGSINLASQYLTTEQSTNKNIDFKKLESVVRRAVIFLDQVVDKLKFPDPIMKQVSLDCRRIGLGVMGWADYLEKINLKYNQPEALELARTLSKFITEIAEDQSRILARQLGGCKYNPELRNISLTCIAPTGGIAGLAGLKGYAIEPFFEQALEYTYQEHIDMQLAWQSGLHNAVSKTINLAFESTVDDIKEVFKYGIENGVKGITVNRDGSKYGQPRPLKCEKCIE